MVRRLPWVVLALVVCLATLGCDQGPETTDPGTNPRTTTPPAVIGTSAEGLEPIPTDGPGESAAVAARPAALAAAKQTRESSGQSWPDLSGASPVLEAYLVRAAMGEDVALLEVRADGKAHNVYAYQKAFDAGSLVWTPKENVKSPSAAPQSETEKAAVAAVEEVMADAFPDEDVAVALHGYRFAYVKDGMIVLTLEIDPEGGVISVGS